jgi:putative tricarboxylic transport membrane protein
MLQHFAEGFAVALQPLSLLAMVAGVGWGIVGGALPGISGSIAMALLLPFTFGMPSYVALMMLSGVYVGAMYGGSITAILIRTPGTAGSAITIIDGYEMQKRGEGARALGISLVTGFIGGIASVFILIFFALPLSKAALAFSAPEYFALGFFGLCLISSLSGTEQLKGLISGILGLMLATVGTDTFSGTPRFTLERFGLNQELIGGIEPIVGIIGLFAVSEVLQQIVEPGVWERVRGKVRTVLPSFAELRRLSPAMIIGIIIGTIEGLLPGGGGSIAAFLSYNEAKRWSKHPEEFGHGSIEGVAAPETANNVVTATALIPLLTFGIPGSNAAAVLLGAMMLHDLVPGPTLFEKEAVVVYSLFASLFISNVLMLVLGYLFLKPCVYLVNVPKPLLMTAILALILVGAYSVTGNMFDVWLVVITGTVGFVMRRYNFSVLAAVLGLVLGFMVEANFRRSLLLSGGSLDIFWSRPITLVLLVLAFVTLTLPLWRRFRELKSRADAAV